MAPHRSWIGREPRSSLSVVRRLVLVCAVIGTYTWCAAQQAQAFIYWVNSTATAIVRANPDGGGVVPLLTGLSGVCGVAVDATHIYWTDIAGNAPGGAKIGRANLDGGSPEPSFITGASNPCGLAVDSGHVYWTNNVTNGSLGRANLDGGGVQQSLVGPMDHPCGVAVDGGHLYWSNRDAGTIGRSNLDGGSADQGFITGGTQICGVAVSAGSVFWANSFPPGGTTLGRANLDGGAADPNFISGAQRPCGLAVDASRIYWSNVADNTIGRANLNGSGVEPAFLAGNVANAACWIAVDPPPPPATPPATVPPATVPPATPSTPVVAKPPISAVDAFTLPGAKSCISRRAFKIRIRRLPGITFVSAAVTVNGKRVKTVARARISAPVNLKGLPKGRFTVEITATTSDGRTVKGKRRYLTCSTKRGHAKGPRI